MESNCVALAQVHDATFFYLAVLYGVDESHRPVNRHMLAHTLREWYPEKNPILIDHVIREALLSFLNRPNPLEIRQVVARLGVVMAPDQKRRMLADLAELVTTNPPVTGSALACLDYAMQTWGLGEDDALLLLCRA